MPRWNRTTAIKTILPHADNFYGKFYLYGFNISAKLNNKTAFPSPSHKYSLCFSLWINQWASEIIELIPRRK